MEGIFIIQIMGKRYNFVELDEVHPAVKRYGRMAKFYLSKDGEIIVVLDYFNDSILIEKVKE